MRWKALEGRGLVDNRFRIRVNIFISLIILIGFAVVGVTSYTTYSQVIKDDIVNISKLTATNIYSDIRNELTKPIFVSLTMANDNFLKNWLYEEPFADSIEDHQKGLLKFLEGIKTKYGYNSVFLISESSNYYYHFNGINKSISPQNEHDQWYYDFIDSGLSYDLDVDTDEANKNKLTIFINCRILDENGQLLGVTGVGLEMNHVQSLLKKFEDEFSLEAMLFNKDGVIQVHSNTTDIESEDVFNTQGLGENKEKITNNKDSLEIFQSHTELLDGYYITRYIEDLDWYLLVKKDTSVLRNSFYSQMIKFTIVYAVLVVCILIIVNRIINKNGKAIMTMSKNDQLTGLLNRRGFSESIFKIIGEAGSKPFYAFVFDIDNFKKVNDMHGHLAGDNVLRGVGQLAAQVFAEKGVISRWGGDEFAGYILGSRQEVFDDIERFFQNLKEAPENNLYGATVSMGVTRWHLSDTEDTLIYRADKALYEAKGSGKAKYCFIEVEDS